ncbi:hypothetical protein NFC81_11260 [Salinispirillum sp. LH 10-3-1]|uniref:Uncharacterized protein n=1 Tax=Salinispirillum sp. LH 10-3-1 TaxID=2952525 RepID=A0AB38YDA2_9GAMM
MALAPALERALVAAEAAQEQVVVAPEQAGVVEVAALALAPGRAAAVPRALSLLEGAVLAPEALVWVQ